MSLWFLICVIGTIAVVPIHFLSVEHIKLDRRYGEKQGKKVRKTIYVELMYKKDGSPRITDVKRISKPGRRVYKATEEIFPVRYGKGILVLSTPKGILTNTQARKERVGGEALFEIW